MTDVMDFSIDGQAPSKVLTPRDANDLAEMLKECNLQKIAVTPWGGGTLQHLGNSPSRMEVVVRTTALDQVIEYEPTDLTVTVQAGITLKHLSDTLGAHNQFLPVDVPLPEKSTVGGVLAAGAYGPMRLRYGPPRDFTLGLMTATVDGTIVKSGGKVVKNVAGYELTKVLIGSFGTMGIITEATFKIFPLPQCESTLLASFAHLYEACEVVTELWQLPTPPLAIELLDSTLAQQVELNSSGQWLVAARFGGSQAVVDAARDKSAQRVHTHNCVALNFTEDVEGVWHTIAHLPAHLRDAKPDTLVLRASVPPKELQSLVRMALSIASAQGLGKPLFSAHAASAIAHVRVDFSDAKVLEYIRQLRINLIGLRGHLLIESAPKAMKDELGAWEPIDSASLRLMRAIKNQFDPNNILNPGRFAGGI